PLGARIRRARWRRTPTNSASSSVRSPPRTDVVGAYRRPPRKSERASKPARGSGPAAPGVPPGALSVDGGSEIHREVQRVAASDEVVERAERAEPSARIPDVVAARP